MSSFANAWTEWEDRSFRPDSEALEGLVAAAVLIEAVLDDDKLAFELAFGLNRIGRDEIRPFLGP